MGILVRGDTEGERRMYAEGYRMGMFYASQLLLERAKEAKEVAGKSPAGPFTDAANIVQARMPKGEIVTSHELR